MATQVFDSVGPLSVAVAGATNASPIEITTGVAHGLTTGQHVKISGVGGNTAANSDDWVITVTSATKFTLNGSTGNGAYTGGTGIVSRRYADLQDAFDATALNLVALNEQHTLLLYDDDAFGPAFELASDPIEIASVNNASPIVVTTSVAHGRATGDYVKIAEVLTAIVANGYWRITVIDATHFSLDGSIGSGTSSGSGEVRSIWMLTGATTDSTRYREIVAAGNQRYNPATDAGVRLRKTGGGTALVIKEDCARAQGFLIEVLEGLDTGTDYCLDCKGGLLAIDSIVGKYPNGKGNSAHEIFSHTAGGVAGISRFTNLVAMGNNVAPQGAKVGIRSFIANDAIANCVVHGLRRAGSIGIWATGASSAITVANCIATRAITDFTFTSGGAGASFKSNISSDSSATGVSGQVGCFSGKTADELFINADIGDFRNRYTSPAIDHGQDFSIPIPKDIVGATRAVPFDIGVFESYFIQPGVAPTVIISAIKASGGDYATLAAWKAATTKNLVAANEVHIAELYSETYAQGGTEFVLDGSICDPTHYRLIRAATGHRYDIGTGSGALVTGSGPAVIRLAEPFARLEGVGVDQTSSSLLAERAAVRCTADRTRVDGVFAQILTGNFGGAWSCFAGDTGAEQRFLNCIARGAGGATGATIGFYVTSDDSLVAHCVAHEIDQSPNSSHGYVDGGSTCAFKNCIATDCLSSGFDPIATAERNEYNCSSDASADGKGSLINKSAGQVFADAALGDFRLRFDSPCLGAGKNLAFETTTDFDGKPRYLPAEIGAYEGSAAAPTLPGDEPGKTHRLAVIWDVVRRDGFAHRWTDHSHPLVVDGQTYVPQGAMTASARRAELALREENLEASGALSDEEITYEDLHAGRYAGAFVRERVVDWLYPFAAARDENHYEIGPTRWNGERWGAELLGVTHRLQDPVGEVVTRNCRWFLGQNFEQPASVPGCRVNLDLITLRDQVVTAVTDAARTFEASAVPGSHVDDDFAYGYLTWTSGANEGLRVEVKGYVQAAREFSLRLELPFDIEVGDTFDVHPGCDRLYGTGCAKFANQLNFRGDKFIPGTHKMLQSPVS